MPTVGRRTLAQAGRRRFEGGGGGGKLFLNVLLSTPSVPRRTRTPAATPDRATGRGRRLGSFGVYKHGNRQQQRRRRGTHDQLKRQSRLGGWRCVTNSPPPPRHRLTAHSSSPASTRARRHLLPHLLPPRPGIQRVEELNVLPDGKHRVRRNDPARRRRGHADAREDAVAAEEEARHGRHGAGPGARRERRAVAAPVPPQEARLRCEWGGGGGERREWAGGW